MKITFDGLERPEMAVASVWALISVIVIDTTDLHEGCRIKAAEEGVLKYLFMKAIPALSKGDYYGENVRYLHKFSKGLSNIIMFLYLN